MRFLLLLLPLTLTACASPGADLSPEAQHVRADSAAARGDTREALAFYKGAAQSGNLDALRTVARAMEEGYIRAPKPPTARGDEIISHHLPILVLPGQAGRWRERYEREKNQQAREGDPYARFRVAEDLRIWKRDATEAERDSARAIMSQLVAENFGPAVIPEAMRLWRDEDEAGAAALLARVEPPYDAQACAIGVMHSTLAREGETPDLSARATASVIDAYEACPDFPNGTDKRSETIVRTLLRSELERDIAHLDSLRDLGVFERHPRFAQI